MSTYRSDHQTAKPATEEDSNISSKSNYPAATAEYHQVVEDAALFFKSLQCFHSSFGTLFSVPTVGGKALDLHRLFVEVTSRGGLEKVIRDRKWKEVSMIFNLPPTITSASFVLRKYYMSLLYHFEQVFYFRKQVPPNSAAERPTPQVGCSVSGTIDGKFDNGYLVTVKLDSDNLMGVLYHIPHAGHKSQSYNTNTSVAPRPRNRKKSRMALQDPSYPIAVAQAYQEKGLTDNGRYMTEMVEYKSFYDS